MYINSDYSNYKYLVDYGSNYVVLSTSHGIYGSSGDIDSVPVVVQYFQPSPLTLVTTYYSYDTMTFNDISDQFSSDFWDRADSPSLFICQFFVCVIIVFVFNQLSKIVKKGGVLGGLS